MSHYDDGPPPLFSAVASSAKQIFHLLRCISFSPKVTVEIGSNGMKFFAEDSRAVQGSVLLEKSLFTSYLFEDTLEISQESQGERVIFGVSLTVLLETLQIFNLETGPPRPTSTFSVAAPHRASAFAPQSLGTTSLCRLSYSTRGAPFQLIMTEAGVTTTCNLTTYEADNFDEIPFLKTDLAHKIILQSSLLYDALQELSSTSPSRLTIITSPQAPYFALSSAGALGSATVEFAKDTALIETFIAPHRSVNTYKFSMVKSASRAMALAQKVSIRGDEQGILNLQFLVEDEGAGRTLTFVNFLFVPFLDEEEDEDYEDQERGFG